MVNCPKCNFNQPKDQFCANCGIDMDAYRPVQPPLFVRLAQNWIFQLISITVIVIIGVALTRAKNRAQIAESFAVLEQVTSRQRNFLSKKPVDQKITQNFEALLPERSSAQAPVQAPAPEATTTLASAAPTAALLPTSAKATDSASSLDGSANLSPTKLKLVFVEMNRASLAALTGDSRSVASAGTYFSGILPDGSRSEIGVPGLNVLDSASDLQMKPNQPIVVFKGSRDPQLEQNIGVTTQITPTFIDEQGAHLQIEVKRTLRAPAGSAGPLIEETYQEQMVLKKDSKGFMSGLLPHRVLSEDEARILAANPTILKVLASAEFQASNSEFVLFIEAK